MDLAATARGRRDATLVGQFEVAHNDRPGSSLIRSVSIFAARGGYVGAIPRDQTISEI